MPSCSCLCAWFSGPLFSIFLLFPMVHRFIWWWKCWWDQSLSVGYSCFVFTFVSFFSLSLTHLFGIDFLFVGLTRTQNPVPSTYLVTPVCINSPCCWLAILYVRMLGFHIICSYVIMLYVRKVMLGDFWCYYIIYCTVLHLATGFYRGGPNH